jgi:membrane fusion protein, heavy metal efflux system
MRKPHRKLLFLSLVISALLPLLAGCAGKTRADNQSQQGTAKSDDPNIFEVSHPEQFPTCDVETRQVNDQLLVNGVVAPDVSLTVHVTSLTGGRVIDIRARLGDEVKKGQVLLVIRSQDLAMAISDYQKFIADELLARKVLDRAQVLYDHGAFARKELEAAQDGQQKAKVDVEAAAERIRILGGELGLLSPIVEIKAPISGTLLEQNTADGEGVKSLDNSPNLFTIADLSRVWVLCDVYENNLAQVHIGDGVDVTLSAYPDRTFKGRISNISRILDPGTRTAKVRVELNNRSGLLRPGMFASARFTAQGQQKLMAVPTSALLRLHDKDWVFRHEGDRKYRRLEVQTGSSTSDGHQVIKAGVQPGDKVVSNALQFANSLEQ